MFPFRWDYKPNKNFTGKIDLECRMKIDALIKFLGENKNWVTSTFYKDNALEYYNDATYFYEYVRTGIYQEGGEKSTVYNYQYNLLNKETFYEILIIKNEATFKYELNVSKIGLNIYETGIAILSFHLINYNTETTSEDVLRINDYGRRIYPQFLDSNSKSENLILATRNAFLAQHIKIHTELNTIFFEDFKQFNDSVSIQNNIQNNPKKLPNTPDKLASLLGDNFKTLNTVSENEEILIRPILDDRMFVICWYGNKSEVQKLEYNVEEKQYGYLNHEANDFWTQYIFVDNSGNTIQSRNLRAKLAEKHTYDRWVDYNTLFGISRYSFVCLTVNEEYAEKYISNHVTGRYFEFIQLALAQRASILKFSDEATQIAGVEEKKLIKEAETLHIAYMRFINRLNFSEVTAQEQGIEMYQKLIEAMKIDRDIKTLNGEIDELHQFVNIKEQDYAMKEATWLNILAAIFLPATFFVSLLGINLFDQNNLIINPSTHFSRPAIDYLIIILFILFLPAYYYRKKIIERLRKRK
jgi:hypothetical protein